tara:strand:+ start:469 stop:1179 length:711 start_codon:yes stop_codon:yes gene_type:complete
MADVRDSIARPSIDTFYQVNFSFGKYQTWLEGTIPDKRRTQARDFQRKMSLLCTQAEIPGTQYQTSTATGHHQGIVEEFPDFRSFPPLNLTFYCDADMVILEVLETWMSYINPIQTNQRQTNAYTRFNYPEDYKEIIHITKFERDTFIGPSGGYKSALSSYEFVNIWPTNLTSMRVAYGDSNVLRCNIQFAYDRFFTRFNYDETNQAVITTSDLVNSSKDNPKGDFPKNESNIYSV